MQCGVRNAPPDTCGGAILVAENWGAEVALLVDRLGAISHPVGIFAASAERTAWIPALSAGMTGGREAAVFKSVMPELDRK